MPKSSSIKPIDLAEFEPLMTVSEVLTATRLSPATLYRRVRAGTFPQPVRYSQRVARYRKSDIIAFISGTWKPEQVA